MHAEIREVNNNYYLVDKNSKFGTLALATKPLRIPEDGKLIVQAGKTLMKAKVTLPCCSFFE